MVYDDSTLVTEQTRTAFGSTKANKAWPLLYSFGDLRDVVWLLNGAETRGPASFRATFLELFVLLD